jgi:hypothetical protein
MNGHGGHPTAVVILGRAARAIRGSRGTEGHTNSGFSGLRFAPPENDMAEAAR